MLKQKTCYKDSLLFPSHLKLPAFMMLGEATLIP